MLGRHIRTAGIRLVEATLAKHALALDPTIQAPLPGANDPQPTSTSPTATPAVPKVVSTPPAT